MSKRKGKDKNKAESKPPYFDLSSLRHRSLQVIMAAAALACCGAYSPLFYLVSAASLLVRLGNEWIAQTDSKRTVQNHATKKSAPNIDNSFFMSQNVFW